MGNDAISRDEALKLLTGGTRGIAEWNARVALGAKVPRLHEADLSQSELSGVNLAQSELSGVNLRGANLSAAKLYAANLSGADLSEADLSGADLGAAHLDGAIVSKTNFSGAILSWANFNRVDLSSANLDGANLSRADLSGLNLRGVNLSRLNLSEASLGGADLSGTNLRGANVSGSDLSGAILDEANFRGAILSRANLSGVNLRGADLSEENLSDANLSGADLSRANLSKARFSGANLSGANLSEADLSGADLREAKLRGGDFRNARLSKVLLSNHSLSGADLSNADLREVDGALFDETNLAGARLPPRPKDRWSILRRYYTGSKLVFLMLFSLTALLPYLGMTIFWVGVSKVEQQCLPIAISAIAKTLESIENIPKPHPPNVTKWAESAREYLKRMDSWRKRYRETGVTTPVTADEMKNTIELVVSAGNAIQSVKRRASDAGVELQNAENWVDQAQAILQIVRPTGEVKERRVWRLLLGTDEGFLATSLVVSLLVYNVARLLLTYFVGPLRDEEERTGFTPAWKGWNGYRWLWITHRVASVLLIVACASGIYQIAVALFTPVLIPG